MGHRRSSRINGKGERVQLHPLQAINCAGVEIFTPGNIPVTMGPKHAKGDQHCQDSIDKPTSVFHQRVVSTGMDTAHSSPEFTAGLVTSKITAPD